MAKKGQLNGIIITFLIAFGVIAVSFLGYKGVATVRDWGCKAELADFEVDLRDMEQEVNFGSVLEKTFSIPCNANKIYFVD